MTDAGEVTLRARTGRPLDDPGVRDVVIATAQSIGERHGVRVRIVAVAGDHVRLAVEGGDLPAVGLAAELRRLTDRWHLGRYGVPLWSAPWDDRDDG